MIQAIRGGLLVCSSLSQCWEMWACFWFFCQKCTTIFIEKSIRLSKSHGNFYLRRRSLRDLISSKCHTLELLKGASQNSKFASLTSILRLGGGWVRWRTLRSVTLRNVMLDSFLCNFLKISEKRATRLGCVYVKKKQCNWSFCSSEKVKKFLNMQDWRYGRGGGDSSCIVGWMLSVRIWNSGILICP